MIKPGHLKNTSTARAQKHYTINAMLIELLYPGCNPFIWRLEVKAKIPFNVGCIPLRLLDSQVLCLITEEGETRGGRELSKSRRTHKSGRLNAYLCYNAYLYYNACLSSGCHISVGVKMVDRAKCEKAKHH